MYTITFKRIMGISVSIDIIGIVTLIFQVDLWQIWMVWHATRHSDPEPQDWNPTKKHPNKLRPPSGTQMWLAGESPKMIQNDFLWDIYFSKIEIEANLWVIVPPKHLESTNFHGHFPGWSTQYGLGGHWGIHVWACCRYDIISAGRTAGYVVSICIDIRYTEIV